MTDSCLSFLIFPSFISLCFSARIRSSKTLAGSLFGSCGTSLPWTASWRMDFFRRSGKSAFNEFTAEQASPYRSTYGSSSLIFATMRYCSANEGKGISVATIFSFEIFGCAPPSPCFTKASFCDIKK